jgi:hypothetical protein
VHRGSVPACAFVMTDSAAAREKLLARWKPGHEVSRLGPRVLWRLDAPERIACDAAPGLPLVDVDGRLVGTPLEPKQVRGAASAGEVLVVEAGELRVHAPGERVDVSTWVDVSAFSLAAVSPLGEVPPPVKLALVPLAPDVARTAAGLGELPVEARQALEAMRRGGTPSDARPTVGPLARALVSALRWLASLLPGRPASSAAGSGAAQPPRRWAWLDRLDRWLDRVLDVSRLSAILGRRQAEYLNRLMEMFEHGDLDQALRHAIPLGGEGLPDARRSLALPRPRASLDIPLGPRGTGPAIALEHDAYEQLRRRYRAAADRLEQQGRYAEAAFVLAELLHQPEEAVAMLERHAQYRLAAELAESRALPPGLQVRLWFLAEDLARAIAVARRHAAFADAITRLERSGHDALAQKLRLQWGDDLAAAGWFPAAVDAVWGIESARALAQRWLELGIAQGGPSAARLRVKKLALVGPDAHVVGALLEVLDGDDTERRLERMGVTAGLMAEAPRLGAPATVLARAAVRASLRDGHGRDPNLIALAADGALAADLPLPPRQPPPLGTLSPPVQLDVDASDRGALPVHDAAWLPDGKMLLALGEAGARLVTRDGRTAAHFDVAAHRLVMFDTGARALLLAPRGEVWSVSRLDLVQRRAEPLCQLSLAMHTDTTDGALWLVAEHGAVMALDLSSPSLRALWRVNVPLVHSIARNALSLSMLVTADGRYEWWRYELPSFTLRVRQELSPQPYPWLVTPSGHITSLDLENNRAPMNVVQGTSRRITGVAEGRVLVDSAADDWSSVLSWSGARLSWQLAHWGTQAVRWVARFHRAPDASHARMRNDVATWSDSDGRVLAVDLLTGRLLRNLRVR